MTNIPLDPTFDMFLVLINQGYKFLIQAIVDSHHAEHTSEVLPLFYFRYI